MMHVTFQEAANFIALSVKPAKQSTRYVASAHTEPGKGKIPIKVRVVEGADDLPITNLVRTVAVEAAAAVVGAGAPVLAEERGMPN